MGATTIVRLVGWCFLVLGLVFAAAGAGLFYYDNQFAARALRAEGVVSDLVRKRDETGYTAIVRFTDAQSQQQEMADRMSSSPPRFSRGDKVDILYDPQSPSSALIDDVQGRYFLPGMFGGLGIIFTILGGAMVLVLFFRKRRNAWLLRFGQPVEADFLHVFRDEKLNVNGANPFRVVAQGADPTNGRIRRYESGPIWVDPTDQLQGRKLRVLVDPKKPEHHMIDLTDVVSGPA
ncbi:hypothetical protein RRU01S_03_00240 [Agrobacterium rubi TR3 = NBRC 13261]|uniref:DUF3592 domain-containing protein n=1 Tax=Agrobacterium rubi TR3 = NBRC 13261 TaxID=1368415 RepID=A0A081CQB1_9HYPH|nr:DUF3592 domain-containing protein [Agrobacterium rubi]MBP1877340.1 hypothetical protein [Agrobacterium rubi]MCL6651522.1 hypothetical protein [Agrobacterium rubi]GAK68857.1 hypothetical protein RRU01S_03_00240 [Agrobacterium rubi TR3 = NBRC 13261]